MSVSTQPTDWQKKVFCMTWLPTLLGMMDYQGDQEYLQALFTKQVTAVLQDPQITAVAGKWRLVWGPAVYQRPDKLVINEGADNTVFVVKYLGSPESESDEYVISIAGTNPYSLYDWIFVDSFVEAMNLWNNGYPKKPDNPQETQTEPAIAAGMARDTNLMTTKLRGNNGKLLLDCLRELSTNATKPMNVTVTGHSMAGGLSPCLGLLLLDRQSEWDVANKATVKVFTLGGPSPGNSSFATYYNNKFGENSQRGWNHNDLVPRAWEKELLTDAATMFEPNIKPNILIHGLLDLMKLLPLNHTYEHINKPQPGFEVPYTPYQADNKACQELRYVVVNSTAQILLQIWAGILSNIPIIGKRIEDNTDAFVAKYTPIVRGVINELLDTAYKVEDIEEAVNDKLVGVLNKMLDMMALPGFNPIGDFIEYEGFDVEAFKTHNILRFFDFMFQEVFQHLAAYVIHFGVEKFSNRAEEIFNEQYALIQKEEKAILKGAILIDYGKADSDDIKEFKNGEPGKLYDGIANVLGELIVEGTVDPKAQTVVVIVEKKKSLACIDVFS